MGRFAAFLLALLAAAGCAADRPRLALEDHPLVGRIWDTAAHRFVSVREVEARIGAADITLLGETHDNPVQHGIQARLLAADVRAGRHPALAMEQIDTDRQAAVSAAAREPGASPADIERAGRVQGWDWALYAPVVEVALAHGLPIVAADIPRTRTRAIVERGLEALGPGEAARLGLASGWTAAQNALQRAAIVAGHCGHDSAIVDKLVPVQRARDAVMADAILAAPASRVVATIGRGHARKDLGVPFYLAERAPARRVLSLGLVEVDAGRDDPGTYREAAPAVFDLVWFTPEAVREDPCAAFAHKPPP